MSHIGALLEGKGNKSMFSLVTLTKSEPLGQALHKLNGIKNIERMMICKDIKFSLLQLSLTMTNT